MYPRTALALAKRYWWVVLVGTVLGAVAGLVMLQVDKAGPSTYTATVRAQVTGVELTPQLATEIDYRINGVVAVGLADSEVIAILRETGVDPGEPGPADDLAAFGAAVDVKKLIGPGVEVNATFQGQEDAEKVAAAVLETLQPRILAAFSDVAGVKAVESARIIRENQTTGGLRSRLLLGSIAGLLAALILVAVMYLRRRVVYSQLEVEEITDLPVVADFGRDRVRRRSESILNEALGVLATKLALASEAPPRFFAWGSVSPSEAGASRSLASGFAKVIGEGVQVWAMQDGALGLWPVQDPAASTGGAPGTSAGPAVLSDPALGSMTTASVRNAMGSAVKESDRVVAAADLRTPVGLAVLTAADVGLIVVALGRTSVADLTDAIVDLKQAGGTPTGVVLV